MHKILGLALASVLGAAGIAFTQPALAQNQITINNGTPCNWSSYSVTSNGNYNFTASGSCGAGTVPAPVCSTAPTVSPSSTIAVGSAATFTVSCSNGPTSYNWIPSGAGAPTVSATANTTGPLTFSTAGTFSYTVTATNGSGTSAASPPVTIVVTQPATAAPTCTGVAQTAVTAGNSATLSATCDQTPTSYVWSATNGGPAIANSTSSSVSAVFPTAGTFNYTVTASNSGFGAGTAHPFTVTVGAMVAPTCAVTANPSTIPSTGGTTTLTATCTSSPGSFTWVPSSGAPGVSGSGASVQATFASGTAAGTYTYAVTPNNAAGNGPVASANVTMQAAAQAGCQVKDKAGLFPSWVAGNAYNTANSPLQSQPANETWAYKFAASDFFNLATNAVSAVQIYEGGNPAYTVSLSTTPCDFTNSPTTLLCQRSGNSGSLGMMIAGSSHPAPDSALSGASYCRAPAVSTEVYVNVKFANSSNVVSGPSSCTTGACTYYLLYQRLN